MNVNVMRIAFRSLLTATNNVHKCASSGRSYSKKGIANKFCLLCFVAVNGSMRSMVCLSWLLCYNKLVSSAEEKFNYWKADCAAIRAKFSSIDWFMEFDDKSVNDTWNQFSHSKNVINLFNKYDACVGDVVNIDVIFCKFAHVGLHVLVRYDFMFLYIPYALVLSLLYFYL